MGRVHSKPKSPTSPTSPKPKSRTLSKMISNSDFKHSEPKRKNRPEHSQRLHVRQCSQKQSLEQLFNHKYVFPVSEKEVGLMQARHYMIREIWGKNFSAPIEETLLNEESRVLDIGCGPGTWLLELATEYPESNFTGIDCAAVFPQEIKPVNTNFVCRNILDGLPFPDNHFDYVYSRFMAFALTMQDWKEIVIPELIRITKPGGWIEFMEMDLQLYNSSSSTKDLIDKLVDNLRTTRSIEAIITPRLKELLLSRSELEQIYHDERTSPLSGNTNIARSNLEVSKWGAECLAQVMCPELGIDEEEYKRLVENVFKEIELGEVYNKCSRFWVRKVPSEEDKLFENF